MVYKYKEAVIVAKDYITLRMALSLAKGDIVKLLVDAIEWWSENVPVNEYYIELLSYEAINKLLKYYVQQFIAITKDIDGIQQLVRSMIVFKSRPLPENEIFLKYSDRLKIVLPCVDNEANLVVLPSGDNVENMRYDDFVIAEAVIMAKVEAIEREQARHRR